MPLISAGLLLFRRLPSLEVFLVHPGGPFWARQDAGAWTIPKGAAQPGESLLAAAQREFQEETGFVAAGPFRPLGEIRQSGGKTVVVWACEGDCDPQRLVSNTCVIEWPPRSGRTLTIPEVDRGAWFAIGDAASYLLRSQAPLLDRLVLLLSELASELPTGSPAS